MLKASLLSRRAHLDSSVKISGRSGGFLAVTDASLATGPLNCITVHLRVTGTVFIAIGSSPVATTSSYRLEPADGLVPFQIQPGNRIAAIAPSGESAVLYYHHCGEEGMMPPPPDPDPEEFITLITDTDPYSLPSISRPGYLSSITDPVFGTTITRISGDPGDPVTNIPGAIWGQNSRHFYSRVSAWNADDSLILLRYNEESPANGTHFFLDGDTYVPQYSRSFPSDDNVRWHPTDPDTLYYLDGNSLRTMNVPLNTTALVKTFAGYSSITFGAGVGSGKGEFSNDGDLVALSATRTSDGGIDVFVYKVSTDTSYTALDLGVAPTYDWAAISPLGNYVVVEYSYQDSKVYDINMVYQHDYSEWIVHQDLGVDHLGREVGVGYTVGEPPNEGHNIRTLLSDGTHIELHSGQGGVEHTSMRNTDLPGWAYSATEDDGDSYINEVIATNTEGDTVRRFCHTHSTHDDYFTEAHACPSRAGTRVLFASAWDEVTYRPIGCFVVDARA